jgi:uncharacterized protein (TIGR02246 family)
MDVDVRRIVSDVVGRLEAAWNTGDGAAFARPFAEDAGFVNIRGEYFRSRDVIAKGHQAIFDTIYKGSAIRCQVTDLRTIAPDVLVAHVTSVLDAPVGPLAGQHRALFTMVLVPHDGDWQIAVFHNTLVA